MMFNADREEFGGYDHYGNSEGKFCLAFDLEEFRFESRKECLRSVFHELLVSILSKKLPYRYRPIPPLCGDGHEVDLLKVFWPLGVRKVGGCDAVTRNNLSDFVSEECKSGYRMGPAIKLVYVKYLNDLNHWLQQEFSKNSKDWHNNLIHKLDILSRELQIRFKRYLPVMQEKEEQEYSSVEKHNENETPTICKRKFYVLDNEQFCGDVENNTNSFTEEDKKLQIGDNCYPLLDGRINDGVERRTSDDYTVPKAQKGVDWLSNIEVDDDGEKYFNKECITNVAAAKKDIEKLLNNIIDFGETVTGDESERFSSQATNVITLLANEVLQEFITNEHNLSDSSSNVGEKKFSPLQDSHHMIPAGTDCGSVLSSHKRKRESLSFSGMLNWLTDIAKRCNDPAIGSIPEYSKWPEFGDSEFWAEALIVRDALMIKRPANRNAGHSFRKDQRKTTRMHPSMYEDDCLACQSVGKLRCSKRISSPEKSLSCTCCNSSIAPPAKGSIFEEAKPDNGQETPAKVAIKDAKKPPKDINDQKPSDVPDEKQVSIGPLFQAEVPQWTGISSKSDPKWLGRRMWPPEDGDNSSRITLDVIGKGRQISCKCTLPNSVECVRFHNAEKRFKLKQELGSLFYRWRFDRMGEEVSLSWTEEEETTFRDIIRSCATSPNMFWKKASKLLPSKTREKLVSYYFNVFLIRHRSYQNRTSPEDIDSDSDEKPCGSISGRLGDIAVYANGLSFTPCVSNMQSTEFQ